MSHNCVLVQNGLRFLLGKPLSNGTATRAENCTVIRVIRAAFCVRALCKRD